MVLSGVPGATPAGWRPPLGEDTPAGFSWSTEADGAFEITDLPAGTYDVTASRDDLGAGRATGVRVAPGEAVEVRVEIRKVAPSPSPFSTASAPVLYTHLCPCLFPLPLSS